MEAYMKVKGTWILVAVILFAGCLSSEAGYRPGIYEGTGRGYRGPIHVRLQTAAAGIEYIVIVRHQESRFPGAAALEELIEAVLEHGSTDLDVVAGATFSSRGFFEAVEDALRKARP